MLKLEGYWDMEVLYKKFHASVQPWLIWKQVGGVA
jgi:hypothetical protein